MKNHSRFPLTTHPLLLLALMTPPLFSACAGPSDSRDEQSVGSIQMSLKLSDDVEVDAIQYEILGPGFERSGAVPVLHSSELRFTVGAIPEGLGYTIVLSAVGADNAAITCEGSADFDIQAGSTTAVSVLLSCVLPKGEGSLEVEGEFNICPQLQGISTLPSETAVGQSVELAAWSSDLDVSSSELEFSWTSEGGTFGSSASETTSFTCTEPGTFVVTATVSDSVCEDSMQAEITCSGAVIEPEIQLIFNEVESSGGTPDDWAELYNAGETPADISGWIFRDNDDTHVYALPAGSVVQPGEYFIVEGMDFGLGGTDSVRLFNLADELVIEYSWDGHAQTTYGRCPDAVGDFGLTTVPTKGESNDCSPVVLFNEVESSGGTPDDWAEIYNAGLNTADLSGWVFSDDDDGHIYELPAGTFVAPGEYLVLDSGTFGFGLGGADSVRLFDAAGLLVDSYSWAAHAATTYARCPNGGGEFELSNSPTKGAENDCSVSVRLNELVSTGGVPGDWVEIVNAGQQATDLSGWVFSDDNDTHLYTLPEGSVIEAGAFLVLDEDVFGFGLGNGDAIRLFDAAGVLVDSFTYPAHAATSYGRCPDGSGEFSLTQAVTKGGANQCALDPTVAAPWPGLDAVQTVDPANTFPENLSGLHFQPASGSDPHRLWGALNGPSKLYQLVQDGAQWVPAAGEWAEGKGLTYPSGSGQPDAEGVTKAEWDAAGIYVSTERDNNNSGVSRLSILRFDETQAGTTLIATHEWNLTGILPVVGANAGLEGIAWIPDDYLVANGFADELSGGLYDPVNYPNHGAGLFVVGVEGTGSLHILALDLVDGTASLLSTIESGLAQVMGLEFDRDAQKLWAICDNGCANQSAVLGVSAAGMMDVVALFAPPADLPNGNNEGFALATDALCLDGLKWSFWSDDSNTGSHALRSGTVSCGSF